MRLPAPFDVVFHAPYEEFHLIKEGIGKLLIKRLFEDSKTKTSKAILLQWSSAYESMPVMSETPRCARKIHTGSLKGCELGVIIYSAFPVLVDILDNYPTQEDHW